MIVKLLRSACVALALAVGSAIVHPAATARAAAVGAPQTPASPTPAAAAAVTLPDRLSDADLVQLQRVLSEPPGEFLSENLVSNETMFQWPIPELTRTVTPGAVYMGVAPDQNFTYILATRPRMAFIVDIRRGNVLEHLLYKALFELSHTRADFVSSLFSLPPLEGVSTTSTAKDLFDAAYVEDASQKRFDANSRAVLDLLTKTHHIELSDQDRQQLLWIYGCFFRYGPDLTYQACETTASRAPQGLGGRGGFGGRFGGFGGMFRSYADLQTQSDAAGVNHTYLATEANYQWIKTFEARNLLVPITGDFMGPKAIQAVGAYVRGHGSIVSTFYASNVEQYLFRSNTWDHFYRNLSTLPLDEGSRFIRSVPNNMVQPAQPGARAASMLASLQELASAFLGGRIGGYFDVVQLSWQESAKRP